MTTKKVVEDCVGAYNGRMTASASSRRYLDLESNISVRDSYTRDDYYGFRPDEAVSGNDQEKKVIRDCAKAYKNVGLIKQVIDLMGDFASQGVRISHPNKSIERFYRRWWQKVNGTERSERFLNHLYRLGNVLVYKSNGKITKKDQANMSKASEKRVIPFKYTLLNPIIVEIESDTADIFSDEKRYKLRLSAKSKETLSKKKNKTQTEKTVKDNFLPLDPERLSVFHYKKDDWENWASPMIHAILDDITMLEKMKLADMSALDGAISNIRLWRIGSLEHKIMPTRAGIDRLRDILATNVGGGTMDLVWGPELDFKESATQVYRFLGNEKYGPVLNSIYGGLGVPQTLTGTSGTNGGFTNNFLSLKTLIEKLEYGRNMLISFWRKEFEDIAKAMSFPSPAELRFDHMILSDEAAEKNLWMQLSDRQIISLETVRERFGESNVIEESRIRQEVKDRKKGKIPPKSDPFHNGNTESDYVKVALQKDTLSIEDVTEFKARTPPVAPAGPSGKPVQNKKIVKDNGRPILKKDTAPRKQKRVLPRSKADMSNVILWSTEAQKRISSILNPVLLEQYGCASLRELTTAQQKELEEIKFVALCGMSTFSEINDDTISRALDKAEKIDILPFYRAFLEKNGREPVMDELRQIYSLAYSYRNF